jgi:hypothetical protein
MLARQLSRQAFDGCYRGEDVTKPRATTLVHIKQPLTSHRIKKLKLCTYEAQYFLSSRLYYNTQHVSMAANSVFQCTLTLNSLLTHGTTLLYFQ